MDLERTVQLGGLAQGDTLIAIENVIGTKHDDVIRGDGGRNVLDGGDGDDTIEGRGDIDILLGGAGNDTLIGASDGDTLDGGAGIDTVDYASASFAVRIALGAGVPGTASGGVNADLLVDIENATGSAFNDELEGSAVANVLSGGAGNDDFEGRAGADTLDGGQGLDTASYANSPTAVSVNLATGVHTGGDAAGDTLLSIENLIGSRFADVLVGNAGDNVLSGEDGIDTMEGRGGNDVYSVDSASDTIVEAGGQGTDEVRASASFTLTAGADVETLATTNNAGVTAINVAGNASGNTVRGNNGRT